MCVVLHMSFSGGCHLTFLEEGVGVPVHMALGDCQKNQQASQEPWKEVLMERATEGERVVIPGPEGLYQTTLVSSSCPKHSLYSSKFCRNSTKCRA